MKLKVFSVFDTKVQAFMIPQFMRTAAEALRAFQTAVLKEDHEFHIHAEDYTLFELGSWDDATGAFDMLPTPFSLGVALQFIVKDQADSEKVARLVNQDPRFIK